MNKLFFVAVIFSLALGAFCCCDDKDDAGKGSNAEVSIAGHVAFLDEYGQPHPSFMPPDMFDKGFSHGDIVKVVIGSDISLVVPFTTGINEVGVFDICLCNYNKALDDLSVNMVDACFVDCVGGAVGDTMIITLVEKGGYLERYEKMYSVYDTIYANYGSPERYANFREIKTTGMGRGVLYRSSNPLNPKNNPARCVYADKLAESVGIRTEIDLADTPQKIKDLIQRADFNSPYCLGLYNNDQTIALGLNCDILSEGFKQKLADGLRFMISHEPPYLVHCNEGKDRCGFVSMLLESFAGGTYQEVADDYLLTFYNFYGVEKGSESYELRRQLTADRMLWLICNFAKVDNFGNINWDAIDASSVDLQAGAHSYFLSCGLTEAECEALLARLR